MVGFIDRALLQLHEGTALADLIKGGGAAPYSQCDRLITSVFAAENADLDSVNDVSVLSCTPMRLFQSRDRVAGTLVTTQPAYATSDLRGDIIHPTTGQWASLFATLQLSIVVATDPGGVESAVISSLENITSFADFESRFRYIDLQAFLDAHQITTVEQLREAAQYVLAEMHLKQPPPFDPHDPANTYTIALDLAVVLNEELDLQSGLMAAQLLRAAGESGPPGSASAVLGQAAHPFAVAVVFPQSALGAGQPTPAQIDQLFAKVDLLPLFANPP